MFAKDNKLTFTNAEKFINLCRKRAEDKKIKEEITKIDPNCIYLEDVNKRLEKNREEIRNLPVWRGIQFDFSNLSSNTENPSAGETVEVKEYKP